MQLKKTYINLQRARYLARPYRNGRFELIYGLYDEKLSSQTYVIYLLVVTKIAFLHVNHAWFIVECRKKEHFYKNKFYCPKISKWTRRPLVGICMQIKFSRTRVNSFDFSRQKYTTVFVKNIELDELSSVVRAPKTGWSYHAHPSECSYVTYMLYYMCIYIHILTLAHRVQSHSQLTNRDERRARYRFRSLVSSLDFFSSAIALP